MSATTLQRLPPGGHHLVSRDGLTVLVRPSSLADREALVALYKALSPESAYRRLLGFPPATGAPIGSIDPADVNACTLVAETGGEIVATATYVRDPRRPGEAEVAFTVADRWQGRGLGTLLLEQLATHARDEGLDSFRAWIHSDNQQMLNVLRDAGLPITSSCEAGLVEAILDLGPTDLYDQRHAERAARAAHESMRALFEPTSVAVIGASRSRGKVGGQVFYNLRRGGFRGSLYPVNASASDVEGVKAYPSVTDIPGPVELAVITVPAAAVPGAVDQCLAKGIKALVVISAGFGETGEAGRAVQNALLDRVRRAGARLVGPNCMGVINTGAAVRLNATFAPTDPPAGRVSMSTQSGALGLAVLADAERLGLGLSTFVSVGNKADVSGNDLIQYWAEDPATDVILMYTEGFGNPRKFAEVARRTSTRKPIVVLKAGRTQAGLRAASSHTGALATDDVVVDALLHQCGVIRVRTLEELFDTAIALGHQPLPGGRRVAILTNAGGAGILAADVCETEGLKVGALGASSVAALRAFLPAAASTSNPVDMIASASPDHYRRAISVLLADPDVDSLLVVYVPPALSDPLDVAAAIAEGVSSSGTSKPVFVSFVTSEDRPAALASLAAYQFPERAAAALARSTAYAEWRRTAARNSRPAPGFDPRPISARLRAAIARGAEWLDPLDVDDVLRDIGVPTVNSRVVRTDEEAVQAARELGFPVVLKALGPTIVHKSDVKGVRLALPDDAAVVEACGDLRASLGERLTGVLVQEMAAEGPEFLVGCVTDPLFGPVVGLGAGGVMAELVGDVVFRLPPLTAHDVDSMLQSTRSARLLSGFRGEPARDAQALKSVVAAIADLVSRCPEIAELDLNPVRVYERGARVLDARIRVAPPAIRPSSRIEY